MCFIRRDETHLRFRDSSQILKARPSFSRLWALHNRTFSNRLLIRDIVTYVCVRIHSIFLLLFDNCPIVDEDITNNTTLKKKISRSQQKPLMASRESFYKPQGKHYNNPPQKTSYKVIFSVIPYSKCKLLPEEYFSFNKEE